MKKIKFIYVIIILVSCQNNSDIEYPVFLKKNINLNIQDTIFLKGDIDNIITTYLYPIRYNSSEFIAFDLIINNLLFFEAKEYHKYQIKKIVDLQTKFSMYSSLKDRVIGVVEVVNNNYLICSEQYFLLLNENLEIQKVFDFEFQDNVTNYYITGDITNIKTNSDKSRVYMTIAPNLPAIHENYFASGRIMEINLKEENYEILPITLPCDYEKGKNYQLFAMPNFTIHNDNIFYIYPGSNYLYRYNLETSKIDSTYISPQHAEINVKEFGETVEDMIYSYTESNIFYQIISNNNQILMLYWKGKKRDTYKRQDGLKAFDCYILGYEPNDNAILFDEIFKTPYDLIKKAYMYKDDKLLFPFDEITETDKIEAKMFKYELIID